ncbi:MAG TPA: AMP-binding protein [Syntrophomonadaceae bacterium]|nr:AMP-binding protein [Syntrophomonadaceae bacterium]HQA07615.1 AMP-binding protein [Syntrophomonadaceae bacterium]HQE23000.1 AMP-binding protein [Syntrophomonadaceae bacterium]
MDFIGKQPGKTSLTSNGISTIRGHVKKRPDRMALRTETFSETYAEMWQRCTRFANALLDRGIKKPDLVATYMPNSYQFAEIIVATQMIGLPLTLGNYRLTPEEIIYQINNCEAKVLCVQQDQYNLIAPLLDRLPTVKEVVLISDEKVTGTLNYEEMIASGSPEEPQVEVLPDDMHLLFYTSGTTGKPKGAVRTMYCDYNMAISTALELGLNRDDSMFVVAPMYAAATAGYLLSTLMVGGSLCIAPGFVPEEALRLIDLMKPSFVFMVPIMYDWMLSLPSETKAKYDLSSIRLAVACGAPMHSTIFQKMRDSFTNAKCINMLGASELGFVTAITTEEWFEMHKEGSIGKGIFDMDLKIVDEHGREVGPGEVGVLYSRSPATFDGYWHNEEGTKRSFLDHEWCSVGDMARMDEDGYIYLVDRAQDMIVTGGTNVYPAEVEGVILKLDGIADVGVIGVPDEKWGEQVKAVVVLKEGYSLSEEDIIAHCRKYLAGFKTPKSVDFAQAIPRNAVGKMLKKELRKPYWEGKQTFIS